MEACEGGPEQSEDKNSNENSSACAAMSRGDTSKSKDGENDIGKKLFEEGSHGSCIVGSLSLSGQAVGSGLVGPGRGVGSPRRRRAASIAPLGSPCTTYTTI